MNEEEGPDWPEIPKFRSLDREFHSLELDGPFTNCMICNAELSDFRVNYCIERIFSGTEPIVEYAMCMACQLELSSELSHESTAAIQKFFSGVDFHARVERLRPHVSNVEQDLAPWLDECLITGKKRSECRTYQIVCQCDGNSMQVGVTPFMLSDDAVAQATEVLSKQTRDRMGDFMGDHFGMPPEFCETPDFFPVLI